MRTTGEKIAGIFGATYLAIGLLGFVATGGVGFADTQGNDLLGIFEINPLHNLVHLGFGAVGLLLVGTHETARWYLVGGGLLYLGVWLYGLAVDETSDANFLPVNDADNWLHFVLGAGMVLLGLWAWSPTRRMSRT